MKKINPNIIQEKGIEYAFFYPISYIASQHVCLHWSILIELYFVFTKWAIHKSRREASHYVYKDIYTLKFLKHLILVSFTLQQSKI